MTTFEEKLMVIGTTRFTFGRLKPASGRSLHRHAGTWVGNDLKECLQKVHDTRSVF
jgi:hypothetical protein